MFTDQTLRIWHVTNDLVVTRFRLYGLFTLPNTDSDPGTDILPTMGNWHGSGSVLESESEFVQWERFRYSTMLPSSLKSESESLSSHNTKKCVTPEPVLEPRFLSQAIFENLSENPGKRINWVSGHHLLS